MKKSPQKSKDGSALSTWERLGTAEASGPEAVIKELLKRSEPQRPSVLREPPGKVWERSK